MSRSPIPAPLTAQAATLGGVDVRDHGARGDGTTNDTAAFNAAIAAAKGGTVIVPGPGTYQAVSIAVNVPGTTIRCTDGATVRMMTLRSGDGSHLFDVTANNVTFRDCLFDGAKASQPGYPEGFNDSYRGRMYRTGIWMSNASGLTVTGSTFQNFYGAAITTRDVNQIAVSDCVFPNNYFESVFATSSVVSGTPNKFLTGFKFVRNRVINARSGGSTVNANGAVLTQYTDVLFDSNVFDGVERASIKLENCTGSPTKYSAITNNDFRNTDMFSAVGFQSGSHYFNIDRNTFTNVATAVAMGAVANLRWPSDTNEHVNITNNRVNSVHAGNMPDGIELIGYGPSMHHIAISNNTISNVSRDAIQLRQTTAIHANPTVHDISITNNDVSTSGKCISIVTGAGYVTPTNVTSTGNTCR